MVLDTVFGAVNGRCHEELWLGRGGNACCMGSRAEACVVLMTLVRLGWDAKPSLLFAVRANDSVVLANELGVVIGREVVLEVYEVRAVTLTHLCCGLLGDYQKGGGAGFNFYVHL